MKKLLFFPLFLFFIFGCSKTENKDRVTIQYSLWGDPSEIKIAREIVNEFKKQNPKINVEILHIPGVSYHDKLMTMIAGNNAPDVMTICEVFYPGFAEKKVLVNVDELIEKDTVFKKEFLADVYKNILEHYKFNNILYGLPKGHNPFVIYYNKTLFDKDKVPYPKDDWTLDDFLKTCIALTKDTNNDKRIDQFGYIIGGGFADIGLAIWPVGGEILNNQGTKCLLNTSESIQGLKWMVDLRLKYGVVPAIAQLRDQSSDDLFKTGKLAMFSSGRWSIGVLKNVKFKWDIVMLPHGKNNYTLNLGNIWCISNQTRHLEESWRFLKFLVSKFSQEAMCKGGNDIPVLKSVVNSNIFLNPEELPNNKQAFIKSIPNSKFMIMHPKYFEISDTIQKTLEKTLMGQLDVKIAANEMADAVNRILDDYNRNKSTK